ncbi:MAG: glycerophosphodiester phosphodiesterase [Nitrolancea sp.]
MTSRRPLLIAHRGGVPDEQDNSAPAFERAMLLDVDMLEFDVRQAGDGALVLLHDPVVHAEGQRLVVSDTPSDLLRQLLSWMLTLDEFFERFGQALPFNLDMKTHGFEAEVVDALRRHGLVNRALISSGHIHSLRRIAGMMFGPTLGLSRGHARTSVEFDAFFRSFKRFEEISLPVMARLAKSGAVMLQHESVDERLVESLHCRGLRVFTWTVDDPTEARRLARIGVDGIASNRPALIGEALGEGSSPAERAGLKPQRY